MTVLRKTLGLVCLAMLPLFLILQAPVYSEVLLNPDKLLDIEANPQVVMEWIDLQPIATAFPPSDALVLVRTAKPWPEEQRSPVLAEIYFDAKRYFLKQEAAQIIEESAIILQENKTRKMQIEAFCDKRGTSNYSLALGGHRAYAVIQYLQNLGISSSQISAASFGSYQPRCQASSTACWQETLRIDHVFQLLAMGRPQSGCMTRLRLNPGQTNRSPTDHPTRQPFLQRIHLAESH